MTLSLLFLFRACSRSLASKFSWCGRVLRGHSALHGGNHRGVTVDSHANVKFAKDA